MGGCDEAQEPVGGGLCLCCISGGFSSRLAWLRERGHGTLDCSITSAWTEHSVESCDSADDQIVRSGCTVARREFPDAGQNDLPSLGTFSADRIVLLAKLPVL